MTDTLEVGHYIIDDGQLYEIVRVSEETLAHTDKGVTYRKDAALERLSPVQRGYEYVNSNGDDLTVQQLYMSQSKGVAVEYTYDDGPGQAHFATLGAFLRNFVYPPTLMDGTRVRFRNDTVYTVNGDQEGDHVHLVPEGGGEELYFHASLFEVVSPPLPKPGDAYRTGLRTVLISEVEDSTVYYVDHRGVMLSIRVEDFHSAFKPLK